MGQKTNPIGLRIAVTRDWRSKWYAGKKEFGKLLTEDRQIRGLLKKKLESASVPQILIERAASRCRISLIYRNEFSSFFTGMLITDSCSNPNGAVRIYWNCL